MRAMGVWVVVVATTSKAWTYPTILGELRGICIPEGEEEALKEGWSTPWACGGEAAKQREATVHSVYFRALWGDHDNWYHFMFGRLAPFLSWAREHVTRGDSIVFLDDDPHKKDRWLEFVLRDLLAPATCTRAAVSYGPPMRSLEDSRVRDALGINLGTDGALGRALQWPSERGWDLVLYGCGSLSHASKRQLEKELDAASNLIVDACKCCRHGTSSSSSSSAASASSAAGFSPPRADDDAVLKNVSTPREEPVITLVDRGPRDRRRSIPNLVSIEEALRERFAGRAEVQKVNFGGLKPCEQWCVTRQSTVLIGQHGAGLANAALLKSNGRAGLLEIAPRSTAFKTMYPCVARLRGAHFERLAQNDTHAPVAIQPVVEAVERLLEKAFVSQTPCRDKWPASTLSKHMLRQKCPQQKGRHTSSLVRSGECVAPGAAYGSPPQLDRSPLHLCFGSGGGEESSLHNRSRAEQSCGYAVATMANEKSFREFELFFRTYSRFEQLRTLYVAADSFVRDKLTELELRHLHPDVEVRPLLDKYRGETRPSLTRKKTPDGLNLWSAFQLEKATILALALSRGHAGVLYVDCDLIFLDKLPAMGLEPLGLSPHRANSHFNRRYGTFNGGMLFVRDPHILKLWRNLTKTSPYFEQSALDPLSKLIPHFLIDKSANVGWYQTGEHSTSDYKNRVDELDLDPLDNRLTFRGEKVQSIHAHVLPGTPPHYYPSKLVPRLAFLFNQTSIQPDFCALAPSLCRPF